jgi:GNAT superfamily N-acetyltransferase
MKVEPLTPDRWDDFEQLFGGTGGCGGCWCMWFRLKRSDWEANRYDGNRDAMRAIVDDGRVPGLIAYDDGEPVGWISVAPREEFPLLDRSPLTKPVDEEQGIWSVVCFYTARKARGRGVSRALLKAAAAHARAGGARILEGYPLEPRGRRIPAMDAYHGTPSLFAQAGFEQVAARKPTRPVMRLKLRPRPR